VIDLDRGRCSEPLSLESLTTAHATELASLLDDSFLHEFTGGVLLPCPVWLLATPDERNAAYREATRCGVTGCWPSASPTRRREQCRRNCQGRRRGRVGDRADRAGLRPCHEKRAVSSPC